MWELEDGKLLRYECHVGHSFTAESLLSEQSDHLEQALWSALRALEEQAAFRRRLALHASHVGRVSSAREFVAQARDAERRAASLRRWLLDARQDLGDCARPSQPNDRRVSG